MKPGERAKYVRAALRSGDTRADIARVLGISRRKVADCIRKELRGPGLQPLPRMSSSQVSAALHVTEESM